MNKWVVANFKMFKTYDETNDYANKIKDLVKDSENNIAICPSFVSIEGMSRILKGSKILIGGQNCSNNQEGAFTGEVSAKMLKSVGAKLVILGHSERRRIFGETDEIVNEKIKQASLEQLTIVVCLADKVGQGFEKNIKKQVETLLKDVNLSTKIIFAFEPTFAIGTGKAMAVCDIEPVVKVIKNEAKKILGFEPQVLYGGSVKLENAKEFLNSKFIDGLLIGGASLDPVVFSKICNM